jgi:hypothetical protein
VRALAEHLSAEKAVGLRKNQVEKKPKKELAGYGRLAMGFVLISVFLKIRGSFDLVS